MKQKNILRKEKLNPEQEKKFNSLYPDAAAFILKCNLENEYNYLIDNEYILNNWQKKRLIELEKLFDSNDGICTSNGDIRCIQCSIKMDTNAYHKPPACK